MSNKLLGPILKCFDTNLRAHNPKYIAQSTKTLYAAPKEPSGPIFKAPQYCSLAQGKLT